MTTLIDTVKPTEEHVSGYLPEALNGRTEEEFVATYLANMATRLHADPQMYHSYGAWWPALKMMLLKRGDASLGQAVDYDVAEIFQMSRDALTIIAGQLYSMDRVMQHGAYNSVHWLDVAPYADDTEPYLYVSRDDSIESFGFR